MSNISRAIERLDFDDISTDADLFYQDTDLSYHILDKDDLVARIEDTIEALESTYFTDDDRVKVKNIRAEANKFSKELGKAVIEHKKRLTTHLDEERKEIVDKLTHMSDRLNDELVKFDQKIRTEKREDMVMAFEDAVFTLTSTNGNTAFLNDLTLDDIENPSWYNRSASANKSVADMTDRINSIVALHSMVAASGEVNVSDLVELLADNEWATGSAMMVVTERQRQAEEAKREAEERERIRAKEIAEAEERGRRQAEQKAKEAAEEAERREIAERERAEQEAKRKAEAVQVEKSADVEVDTQHSTLTVSVQYTNTDTDAVTEKVRNAIQDTLDTLVTNGDLSSATVHIQ